MEKFLIKFNNGLVDTTILMVGENETEVVEAFKEDCNSHEAFIKGNCFPECKFLGIANLSETKYSTSYAMGNFRAVRIKTGEVVYAGTEYDCDQYCNDDIQLRGSLIKNGN